MCKLTCVTVEQTSSKIKISTISFKFYHITIIDYLFVFVGAVFVALRSEEPDLIP